VNDCHPGRRLINRWLAWRRAGVADLDYQAITALQEHMFVRGFVPPYPPQLVSVLLTESDVENAAELCIRTGMAPRATLETLLASPNKGARDRCLAIHEAGHAIV